MFFNRNLSLNYDVKFEYFANLANLNIVYQNSY